MRVLVCAGDVDDCVDVVGCYCCEKGGGDGAVDGDHFFCCKGGGLFGSTCQAEDAVVAAAEE